MWLELELKHSQKELGIPTGCLSCRPKARPNIFLSSVPVFSFKDSYCVHSEGVLRVGAASGLGEGHLYRAVLYFRIGEISRVPGSLVSSTEASGASLCWSPRPVMCGGLFDHIWKCESLPRRLCLMADTCFFLLGGIGQVIFSEETFIRVWVLLCERTLAPFWFGSGN